MLLFVLCQCASIYLSNLCRECPVSNCRRTTRHPLCYQFGIRWWASATLDFHQFCWFLSCSDHSADSMLPSRKANIILNKHVLVWRRSFHFYLHILCDYFSPVRIGLCASIDFFICVHVVQVESVERLSIVFVYVFCVFLSMWRQCCERVRWKRDSRRWQRCKLWSLNEASSRFPPGQQTVDEPTRDS